MEVIDVDLDELQAAFDCVEAACREEIEELYLTSCPNCGNEVPADWFEWSKVYRTPKLKKRAVLIACKKVRPGIYELRQGRRNEQFRPLQCEQLPDELVAVHIECPLCHEKATRQPLPEDVERAQRLITGHETIITRERLGIPPEAIPDANMARENALFKRGITHFRDLFTKRNLIANGRLKKAILNAGLSGEISEFIALAFSGSLRFSNMMVFRDEAWRGDRPFEWAKPAYWLPDSSLEANVWTYFSRRLSPIVRAKKYTKQEILPSAKEADPKEIITLTDPTRSAFCALTCSSDSLPFPNDSVDVVITDPPYGGNVQYLEVCDFWVVWLHEWINVEGVTDKSKEAITTRHHGFAGAKDLRHYRNMLFRVFKECHRVLKPDRWMVMTFHCREFKVWSAVHLAAHDAGFVLSEEDGMIHQPAIKLYEHTISTRRSGSMLGDFILSFRRVDKPPTFKAIEHAEIGRHIERLAAEAVIYHNGATLSTIYMKLIPWLLNNNLLEEIDEKQVVPYLERSFFQDEDGRWRLKEDLEDALQKELEEYSRQHYKSALSETVRMVPVEARLEFLVRRLLYRKGQATQDDVLNEIYTNLINSNAADYGEIQRVLNRIADLRDPTEGLDKSAKKKGSTKRKVWRLKEDIERERLWAELGADVKLALETTDESDHDLAINRLVEIAGLRGLKSHIGRAECAKYADFRRMSELPKRVKGLPQGARDIIEQIDVLWHNGGRGVVAAIEVEKTTTIVSGIQRMRDLLAAMPEAEIDLYLVIPKARGNELRAKLGSPANRKDGLHKKIGYIYLEDLQINKADASGVELEKIVRWLNGGDR